MKIVIQRKFWKKGKNDASFIEIDDEAKADSLFLKKILFSKENINDKEYNDLLNKLK